MKVIRAMSVTYNSEAECLTWDCGFVTLPSRETRNRVKSHIRATGHEVRVTTKTVDLYRPDNTYTIPGCDCAGFLPGQADNCPVHGVNAPSHD
jgi:hypothetical protein